MLIGELSRKSGISHDTIRYYQKIGLLSPVHSKNSSSFIQYSRTDEDRLSWIGTLKSLGFTLTEIKAFFSLRAVDSSCRSSVGTLVEKLSSIESEIRALTELRDRLNAAICNCQAGVCEFENSFK